MQFILEVKCDLLVTIVDSVLRSFHDIGYSGISQIASEDERAVSSYLTVIATK